MRINERLLGMRGKLLLFVLFLFQRLRDSLYLCSEVDPIPLPG